MVLLIGNYPADQQQSMQRFSAMMLHGLTASGIKAELIVPDCIFGRFLTPGSAISKWLGYLDKYILFPFQLRWKLATRPSLVHICDHSNAVYARDCPPIPVVVTCHDLLAVRGALDEETDCPASFTGRFLQRWILKGLRSAQTLACASRATAADARRLVEKNGRPEVTVIPLGLNYDFQRLPIEVARSRLTQVRSFDPDVPFALHVGSNLRRKNRDAVMRIFALIKDSWNGRMVFAGDPLDSAMRRLARDLQIENRVVEVTNASSELLEALYNCAVALVYPSRFEGFGWPIIEAQACGCPVLTSDRPPMDEVGGDAAIYVDPEDPESAAIAIKRALENPPKVRESGLHNAARFNACAMTDCYVAVYERIRGETLRIAVSTGTSRRSVCAS